MLSDLVMVSFEVLGLAGFAVMVVTAGLRIFLRSGYGASAAYERSGDVYVVLRFHLTLLAVAHLLHASAELPGLVLLLIALALYRMLNGFSKYDGL